MRAAPAEYAAGCAPESLEESLMQTRFVRIGVVVAALVCVAVVPVSAEKSAKSEKSQKS